MIGDLKWAKLFIEGVQVPFSDASVTCQVNGFNSCSFSIVPTEKGLHFPYRSIVQLFVLDQTVKDYVYLFEGEIVSVGCNFNFSGAGIQYTAVNFHHYLTQILMSFVDPSSMNDSHTNIMLGIGMDKLFPVSQTEHFSMLKNNSDGEISTIIQLFLKDAYDSSMAYNDNMRNCKPKFYYERMKALELIPGASAYNRYSIANSGTASQLLGIKAGDQLLRSVEQHITAKMSRWDVLQQLFNLIGYDFVSPVGSIGNNFIAKPQCLFVNPPMCNVVFPNMSSTFNYSDPMSSEPTRLVGSASGLPFLQGANGTPGANVDLWYPNELHLNLIKAYKQMKDGTFKAGEFLNSCGLETDNEAKYGQKMQAVPIQYSRILSPFIQLSETDDEFSKQEDFFTLYNRMLEYEFYKLKYMPKSGSFSGPFNFSLVPGFPIVIMKGAHGTKTSESFMAFVGYLQSVTHVVSCSAGISTSGSVTCIRSVYSEQLSNPLPWLAGGPVKEDFNENNIGGKYATMLGCQSLRDNQKAGLSVAVNLLFKEFKNLMNDDIQLLEYTRRTCSRKIATLSSVKDYYGLGLSNAKYTIGNEDEEKLQVLTGKIYTKDFRDKVEEYMQELQGSRVLLGL